MPTRLEENAPEVVDHFCARGLRPVAEDARSCPNCSRRFEGRGRFDRLVGSPPSAGFDETKKLLMLSDFAIFRIQPDVRVSTKRKTCIKLHRVSDLMCPPSAVHRSSDVHPKSRVG